jgi:hypothetical protein
MDSNSEARVFTSGKESFWKNNKILLFFLVSILLTLALILYFLPVIENNSTTVSIIDQTGLTDTIRFEIIKSLLQLLIVVIIGALITYFIKLDEDTRKDKSDKKKTELERYNVMRREQMDFVKRLRKLYSAAKSCRRKLKAAGFKIDDSKEKISFNEGQHKFYTTQINLINEIQLTIEDLRDEVNISSDLEPIKKGVTEELKKMEHYLNEIIKEFRDYGSLKDKEDENFVKIKKDELSQLIEFISSTKENREVSGDQDNSELHFKKNFSMPYHKIVDVVTEQNIKKPENNQKSPLKA